MSHVPDITFTKILDNMSGKTAAEKLALIRRRREDFDFMVLCAQKGNMGMYQLLRDRDLDKESK